MKRAWIAAVAVALLVALVVLGVWRSRHHRPLRIASGSAGGTTLPLGQALADAYRSVHGFQPLALETPGGVINAQLVERGEAELGLVPNNAPGIASLRVLAPLYDEVLQIVVRGDELTSLADVRGKRVALGGAGSGTERLATSVLAHFGVRREDIKAINCSHDEAASAFERGEVDVAFSLTGLHASAIARMLAAKDARLFSFGEPGKGDAVAGLHTSLPYVDEVVIPANAYGREPKAPIGAVGVDLLLVARDTMSEADARAITEATFANKAALAEREPALASLRELKDDTDLHYPVHPGATQYYRRDDPPFILAWADTISLAITVVLLVWSGVAAIGSWRASRRRGRVEAYYGEVQEIARAGEKARTFEDFVELRHRLHAIRRRAFKDLMDERLAANESFTIFQDFVRSELAQVEASLAELRRGP